MHQIVGMVLRYETVAHSTVNAQKRLATSLKKQKQKQKKSGAAAPSPIQ
jgi:hypothetical protein